MAVSLTFDISIEFKIDFISTLLKKKKKTVPSHYIYNICTLSVNIKFICTSFRNRQNSELLASFSGLFRSEYK